MNNQLAIREPNALAPSASEFGVMKEQASMLIKSGFLPSAIKTPEQAVAIILTGRELGIGTMQALNTINVIQGKPTVSPQLMLALIERSGQLENIIVKAHHSPDGRVSQVSCTMKRKGRTEHTEIFGSAEANALGLLSKDNYRKQPAVMFRWRAVAACARVVFPDVILGIYSFEEMGAEVEIGDNDELTMMPPEEKRQPVVVKMPETIQAEPVFDANDEPVFDEKPDYTDEWNAKLSNPTVKKDVAPVTPETKGKLLWEAGHVSRSAIGYEVADQALGEVFLITRKNNVVLCNCDDYAEGRKVKDNYRCAHIEAVKFFAASNPLKQAA